MTQVTMNLTDRQVALLDEWKAGKNADDLDIGQVILAGIRALEQMAVQAAGRYMIQYLWKDNFGHVKMDNDFVDMPQGPTELALKECMAEKYVSVLRDVPVHQKNTVTAPVIGFIQKIPDSPVSDLAFMALAMTAADGPVHTPPPLPDVARKGNGTYGTVYITYGDTKKEFMIPLNQTARDLLNTDEILDAFGIGKFREFRLNGLMTDRQLQAGDKIDINAAKRIKIKLSTPSVPFQDHFIEHGLTPIQLLKNRQFRSDFKLEDGVQYDWKNNGQQTPRVIYGGDSLEFFPLNPGDSVTPTNGPGALANGGRKAKITIKFGTSTDVHYVDEGILASEYVDSPLLCSQFGLIPGRTFFLNGKAGELADAVMKDGDELQILTIGRVINTVAKNEEAIPSPS